jgi:hypothetical protein
VGIHPAIHVIYVSGYAQGFPEAQAPARASFLKKPFRFVALAEQLKLIPRRCDAPSLSFDHVRLISLDYYLA